MHKNMDEVTHNRTADLFGSVNMGYFSHIRKMVAKGVAVKMYPNDPRYDLLPNEYLDHAEEINTPVLFVSGEHNKVFLDSERVTFETLKKLKPDNQNDFKCISGYGHQDIFMGKDSCKDVFPIFLEFLKRQIPIAATAQVHAKSSIRGPGSSP